MLRSRPFRLPFRGTLPSVETRRALVVFALVFLYVLLMPWLGYVAATFLLLFAFQTIFTARRDLRFLLIWAVGLSALVLALLTGVPLGLWAALRRGGAIDYAVTTFAALSLALPSFVTGPLLALAFGLWLHWLPVAGWQPGGR